MRPEIAKSPGQLAFSFPWPTTFAVPPAEAPMLSARDGVARTAMTVTVGKTVYARSVARR